MRWTNSHLHQFHINDQQYGEPDPYGGMTLINEKGIKLSSLLTGNIREFVYEYDFGDDWLHRVVVENVQDANPAWNGSLCVAVFARRWNVDQLERVNSARNQHTK